MSKVKKHKVLFITEENSSFDEKNKKFDELFALTHRVTGEQKALKLIYNNNYDIIINDMSREVLDGITFMKQIKKMKEEPILVSFVLAQDEEKIGDLLEHGIHAFVLTPQQLEPALETIWEMKP